MSATLLKLRFPKSRLAHWAARYPSSVDDAVLDVAAAVRRRGHLTKRELIVLGDWKTPRSRPHRLRNSEALVRDATRFALTTKHEELKIGVLRLLEGVEWPTASAILHLCDAGRYPILDTRALWACGDERAAPYTFERWLAYVLFTRRLSEASGCTMREVDRALWQYAKERG